MRFSFILIFLLSSFQFAFSQYNPKDDKEPKLKRPYKLSDFSIHYSGAIFDFSSCYLTHMHEISSINSPQWTNMDSTIKQNNRSEIYTRFNFQKQLVDQESSFYGTFAIGLSVCAGGRLDVSYFSDEKRILDSAIVNSDPVTNLDSTTILQNEYRYSATEIGLDIAYTIGSSPKPTFKGEFGIGFSTLYTISDQILFIETESLTISYLDQFSRIRNFNELNKETTELSAQPQLIMKLYVPVILSYKLNHHGKFALSTMFSGGVEFQKPKSGNFYTYPYFTIGIGCKYYF